MMKNKNKNVFWICNWIILFFVLKGLNCLMDDYLMEYIYIYFIY